MSFRDAGSAGARSGGHGSYKQPKQRRDEDSPFERSIKANIQEMQDSVRMASEQLGRAQRSLFSQRMSQQLDSFLERSRELAQETEQLFRDWTVHFAGEPSERHRKKFSYEKLQKAFEEEVKHLKDVARRAVTAQQEAMSSGGQAKASVECRTMCEEQGSLVNDEEHGLLDDVESSDMVSQMTLQEDTGIQNRIAQEREEGIRRIQSQVSEVNQIFRDLASIVNEQGQSFATIENQAESASSNTKETVRELKKAVDRQRGSRERICCMLGLALLILVFIILPHLHMGGLRAEAASVQLVQTSMRHGGNDGAIGNSGRPSIVVGSVDDDKGVVDDKAIVSTLAGPAGAAPSAVPSDANIPWDFQLATKVIAKSGHTLT